MSAIRLPEDSLISERVGRVVRNCTTPVGIINSRYGTSSWQVGALGSVKWIVSNEQLPARREHDPPWFNAYEPNKMDSVEVVIIDGELNSLPSLMWNLQDLKIVVCVKELMESKKGRRRRRRKQQHGKVMIPEGWVVKKHHLCHHDDVGGVTNGLFEITMLGRDDVVADWSLQRCVTL